MSLRLIDTINTAFRDIADLSPSNSDARITIDGQSLTISQLVAVARYGAVPQLGLDRDPALRAKIEASVACLNEKLEAGEALYGINTGFGGSADSRTNNPQGLQMALLQHQQCGQLEVPAASTLCTPSRPGASLLLSEEALSMPESWVRGAMAVRLNSLSRGHSGVRTEVLQRMGHLLKHNITPVVPVRGSISASGDLSTLSYIAGCLAGQDNIEAWVSTPEGKRIKVPSSEALASHGLTPVKYGPKEALGLLNGTAPNAALGGLVIYDAVQLAFLTHMTTAMAVEAETATDASFVPFIHQECRPHPGQIESAATLLDLLQGSHLATHLEHEGATLLATEDEGSLRQDRYPLRTAPQFMGPQLEDLQSAWNAVVTELNSTTDNPLISVQESKVHHGGNFQAMSVTNAVEKTRLCLAHFGKLTFAQGTELINPSMNRGLPSNLASTDPSLNFHCKGIDIAMAALTSELEYLASPVSTHIQSAEMGNQAVNSLALISARYTVRAIDTLQQLLAYSLYLLCQALDLRALQRAIYLQLEREISASISRFFSTWIDAGNQVTLSKQVFSRLKRRLEETSARDLEPRLREAYMVAGFEILKFFAELPSGGGADPLRNIMAWRDASVKETHALYQKLTLQYLETPRACHASPLLGKTRPIYEFVRRQLGVGMHGIDNYHEFGVGQGANTSPTTATTIGTAGHFGKTPSIGQNVSVILASIRNGDMYKVMHETLRDVQTCTQAKLKHKL
ncbi:unnamed protein product [Parajaminaea phylloscopi]